MYILFKKTIASLTAFSLLWSNLAFCMEPDERPYTAMRSPRTSADVGPELSDNIVPPPPPMASPADGNAISPRAIELVTSGTGEQQPALLQGRRNSPPGGAILSISMPIAADISSASRTSGPGNEAPVSPLPHGGNPSQGAGLRHSDLAISIVPVGDGSAALDSAVTRAAAPSSPTAAPTSGGHRDSPESHRDTPPSAGDLKEGDERGDQLAAQPHYDDSPLGDFLRKRGWSRADVEKRINLNILQDIVNVELSWCPPRWDSFDLIIERSLYPLFLNRQGIYFTNAERNAPGDKKQCWPFYCLQGDLIPESCSSCSLCKICIQERTVPKQCCGCFCIQGRSIPFKSESEVCRATTLNTLRLGIEDGIRDGIHITFFSLLLYQLAHASSVNLFKTYLSADETSLIGIAQLLRQKPGLLVLPCLPLLLGIGKALWRACNIDSPTKETVDTANGRITNYGEGFLDSYVLPLIPFTPLRRALTTLEPLLLWQGQLPRNERERAFQIVINLANTQTGYSRILVMNTLAHVVHGLHLMDFGMLTKTGPSGDPAYTRDDLIQFLYMKTRGLQVLRDLRKKLHAEWNAYDCAPWDVFLIREIVEIDCLLWGLGQSPSCQTSLAVFTLKAIQLFYNIFSIVAIFQTLKSFFDCPNRPGFSWENGGYQDWSMSFTTPCFDEVIRQFNTIPGQPVSTLIDLIPEFGFPDGTYALDLSHKGLTGGPVIDIIMALKKRKVNIKSLNLEGNFVNKASDFQRLFPLISSVEELSLADNGIEWNGVGSFPEDTIGLAESIGNLTSATYIDLSRNRIGINSVQGMVALGQRLASPILTHFNFSNNFMGRTGSDGAVAFGNFALRQTPSLTELDLGDNWLENIDSLGTQAITSATRYLPLRFFSLRNNLIGTSIYDPYGFGALGNGLPTTLTELDVSGNLFSRADFSFFDLFTQGLRRLSALANFKVHPQIPGLNATHVIHLHDALAYTDVPESEYPFTPLNTDEEVDAYFDTFPLTTSDFNLRARIGNPAILPRVMVRLAGFPVQSLDASENWFEYSDPQGGVPFGLGLRNLTLLERLWFQYNYLGNWDPQGGISIFDNISPTIRLIDGSHNVIGGSSVEDTRAAGRNLPRLTRLSTLLLIDNAIEATGIEGTVDIGNGISASPALIILDMSQNYMGSWGPNGLVSVFQGLQHKLVTSLGLSNNFMGWTGTNDTEAFAEALPDYRHLQSVDLSVNNIGSKGAAGLDKLVSTLPTLPNLQTIRMAGAQNISWTEGAQALTSLKGDALRQACEAELCTGTPINPSTPSQSTDQESSLAASSQASSRLSLKLSKQRIATRASRSQHRFKARSVKKRQPVPENNHPDSLPSVSAPAVAVPLDGVKLNASAVPISPTRVDIPTPAPEKAPKSTQKKAPQRPAIVPSHEDVVQYLARSQRQEKTRSAYLKSWFSPSSWIDWATQAAFNHATEVQPDGSRVNAMPATFPHLLNPQVNDWAVPTGEREQSGSLLNTAALGQRPLPSLGATPMPIGTH